MCSINRGSVDPGGGNTVRLVQKPFALTPPSPLAPAPLSQAWERGWG